MAKKRLDPADRGFPAQAYCPRCRVECFYPVGEPHYRECDEILINLKDRYGATQYHSPAPPAASQSEAAGQIT